MATVGPKTADIATMIDDFASMVSSLANWSDGDTDITNDGSDNNWNNNGRVFYNSNTGLYYLFYWDNYQRCYIGNEWCYGPKLLYSDGWNTTDSRPSGNSNYYEDYVDDTDLNRFQDSYTTANVVNNSYENTGTLGLVDYERNRNRPVRTTPVSYFMSAQTDGTISISAWCDDSPGAQSDSETPDGVSSYMAMEPVTGKFFTDGVEPFVAYGKTFREYQVVGFTAYGWSSGVTENTNGGGIGTGQGIIGRADWGYINPAVANDDFIFQNPVVYRATDQTVPVAFLDSCLPSKQWAGPSTGDTVTEDSTTYMFMAERGDEGDYYDHGGVFGGFRHE